MTVREIEFKVPRWGLPYLEPKRYKGLKGGRGSGKSHFFAERCVEEMVADKDLPFVCIREIQKSLRFSAKKLIESKIEQFGVGDLFEVTQTEIRRRGGDGIIIFQGMQDHTADSIKSLEGFKRAWVEEAQNLSHRSMQLLLPTIRAEGSEIWFSWNPDQDTDPVDKFFREEVLPGSYVLEHINYDRNPWFTDTLHAEMERHRRVDPETFGHVWLGEYNLKSDVQVLCGKWVIDEFTRPEGVTPYFGADWGFSQDPTVLICCFILDNVLYIEHELYRTQLEISDTSNAFKTVPDAERYVIRADSARPETISHVRKEGLNIQGAEKWKGSVEDGIAFLRSFDKIVIHERCKNIAQEARLYSHKIDRLTGDILPDIIDKHNHGWDAVRYALQPLIQRRGGGVIFI